MRQPNHKAPKLPRQLLDSIGEDKSKRKGRYVPSRKERRQSERDEKRINARSRSRPETRSVGPTKIIASTTKSKIESQSRQELNAVSELPPRKSGQSSSKKLLRDEQGSTATTPSGQVSRRDREQLKEMDAHIDTLEKKLGLKKKKNPTGTGEDDGLDLLLDGLGEERRSNLDSRKRKQEEDDIWLERKRQKSAKALRMEQLDDSDEDAFEDSDIEDDDGISEQEDETLRNFDDFHDTITDSGFSDAPEDEEFDDQQTALSTGNRNEPRRRENPYVAPATSDYPVPGKYIPPAKRGSTLPTEQQTQLQRQIRGQLNRLSEANFMSIVREIEQLYQTNPRQNVSATTIDLVLCLVCERTSVSDAFLILHAGFLSATYKIIGADFGAQLVESLVSRFDNYYFGKADADLRGKRCANLIGLIADLYLLGVVGCNIVFDYVRLFLEDLTESNTELLLRTVKHAGSQLRHDDPSSLKDIVGILYGAVGKCGEENLSTRTKFMIETINDLRNNRMKTDANASSLVREQVTRMKKQLGTLNSRGVKASEPLRIGLADVRNLEKKGKWWLVGASWKNDVKEDNNGAPVDLSPGATVQQTSEDDIFGDYSSNLVQLAREQGMNTDVRRAIFIAIMSATDFKDAHLRLTRLRLKRSQEYEIPKILMHCVGAETVYNPYYALVAHKICASRRLRKAFQFSLWDLFRRFGETNDMTEAFQEDQEDGEGIDMTMESVVNLAQLFGNLVASNSLPLVILKHLDFAYLQRQTKVFCEVMIVTVILQIRKTQPEADWKSSVLAAFTKVDESLEMISGLQYFVRKVVGKGDVAPSKVERATVREGCRVAIEGLAKLSSSMTVET